MVRVHQDSFFFSKRIASLKAYRQSMQNENLINLRSSLPSCNPLVSVIIPIYNQETFLADCIESVIQQTYQNWEIILCDDGSTDSSPEICQAYALKEARIHYLCQENKGDASARNLGIRHAQGDYFAMLDADDLFHREKIEILVGEFRINSQVDLIYTGLRVIDENGQVIAQFRAHDYPPENVLIEMFIRNEIATQSVVMGRRECFERFQYNEKYRHASDYDLMLCFAHCYTFKYIDLLLTDYRRHQQNMTNKLSLQWQGVVKILSDFGYAHIANLIDQSCFPKEEKNFLKGFFLYNLMQYSAAVALFKNETNPRGLFYLGNCYVQLNCLEEAISCYQAAVVSDDCANPACYNNLGVLYAKKGKIEQARESFKKSVALKPGYLDATQNLQDLQRDNLADLKFTWRELRPYLIPYKLE